LVIPQAAKDWPTEKWSYDSPKNHNINEVALWELEDRMSEQIELDQSGGGAVIIARDGYIVYENKEGSFNYTYPSEIWSLTKSFVSALIGIAIDEGYIGSVDDKVLDYFKDWDIDNIDEMKEAMTIKDVLTMRSGLRWAQEKNAANWIRNNSNPALALLSNTMDSQPGTEWKYNTAASSILTALIQQVTGMPAFEYAKEKLFEPLGITDVKWDEDKAGINFGGFGLEMLPHDLLKFGYLFLKNGEWDGKQIISEEWVKESTACDIESTDGDELYGYHWWGVPGVEEGEYLIDSTGYSITLKEAIEDGEIYRATGYIGQYIYVWPKYNTVIVIRNYLWDLYNDRSLWGKYGSDIGHNIVLVDVLASIVEAVSYTKNSDAEKPERSIMPDMTGELVIYASPYNEYIINAALKIYKKQYPNVEVNFVEFEDYTEYSERLKTEVIAGKGPDLWFGLDSDFTDIFKTADAGVFEDLAEYMKNDDTDWSGYNKIALDAGIYKGRQYFIPVAYQISFLMTTEEIMQEEQIDFEGIKTYSDFIKVIRQFQQKYSAEEKCLFRGPKDSVAIDESPINYFPWNGMRYIDYETGKVINDSEILRDTMEAMKWAYMPDAQYYSWGATYGESYALRDKVKLFAKFNYDTLKNITNNYSTLTHYAKPLYMPMPDIDGKVTAAANVLATVFKNSKNKMNAYNFIKILLSEKIQSDDMYWQISVPVLNRAVEARVDKILGSQPANGYKIEAGEYYPPGSGEFYPEYYVEPVPYETVMEIADMLTNIDRCVIQSNGYWEFWRDAFNPYYENGKTYEQCFAVFKNSLELYVSE